MDLQNLYLPVLFSVFLFFLIVLRKLKKTDSIPKLPPGPWKLPIIGNIHNLVGSLPHHRLTDLAKKYGPLMHLQLGEVSTIVVSSPEYAKEVMKTHDIIFSSRPRILASDILSYNSSGMAFAPYGNYWRQLRKICMSELLSHKRVQSFRPIREEVFSDLVKCVASSEGIPFNLTKQVMSTISIITSRAAFGKECKYRQKFVAVVKEATEVAGGFNLGDLYPSVSWLQYVDGQRTKLEEVHRLTDRIMQNIIDEHKVARSRDEEGESEVEEDIVDVLLKLQESGNPEIRLTNDNIKAVILDMFGGGTETSSTTIIWAMAEMTKNPRVMKKAQAEIREVFDQKGKADETGIDELKYLKLVVKETLRLHPPGPLLLPRECGEACEINGYHIPFKSKVIVNAWAIGRDPNCWTEPERFYPERFADSSIDYKGTNFEFIPFGAGRRICPGINFGMMNVELPLALLLYHFDWKLPDGMKNENLDMTEAFGSAVMRKEDLYLIPSIHNALLVT